MLAVIVHAAPPPTPAPGQLPCFLDRNRRPKDSRVTASMTARASAMSPASWPASPGCVSATGEAPEIGSAFALPPWALVPGAELGDADGLIAGNRPDALPTPMSWLEKPLRFGMGPSGSAACDEPELPAGELAGEADAEVTATVSAADGGVHFAEVETLAAAVSFTEVTEVALDATAICAPSLAGCFSDTELTGQVAVPLYFPQPLVNVGFWLEGCAVRVTDTLAADPLFVVDTSTR
jgi:hypothetical protein